MVTRTVIRITSSEAAAAADITTLSLAAVDSSINSPNDQINKKSPQLKILCNHHPSCTKRAQHPSTLCWQHGAKESICSFLGCHNKGILLGLCGDHGGLVQLCRHRGCINVVDFERRGGLCYIHQIGPMDGEESVSEDSEGEIRLCSFRGCISNASTDEGLCDMHSAHDNNYCFTDVGKKRALPLGDSIGGKGVKKRQKMNAFTIDLSDVPPQPPIPKSRGRIKEGASKYTGVSFIQQRNEWVAQVMIESKGYIIGYYESEEEAAVDYARAIFKYKGGVYQQSFEVDLIDVPPQPPILKREGRIKDGTSKYLGVSFDITKNKWQTQISIGGKKRRIGYYESEEEAAADYARALFKYKGQGALEKARKQNTFIVDLADVPPQLPIPKSAGQMKEGASKYAGIYFRKETKKWAAQIRIDGTKRIIGYYEDEEEAAVDYARAVFKYNKGRGAHQQSLLVDLNDVPPQSPIPKSAGRIKEGASKYKGVCFNRKSNKWQAEVNIEGKSRFIGSYDDEEEAAVDYARAVFKYKGQGALDKAMEFIIDLSDISPQLPIPKSAGRIKEGASKYTGVSFNKQMKKWKAEITVKGKSRFIGSYDDEEEAAVDYARAVFKYKPVLQTT